MTDYKKLTVLELRQILVERNLPSDGLKADLINRLINNDEETEKLTSENNVEKIETSVVTATNTETTNAISTEAALNVVKDITEKNGNIDDDYNNKNKTTANGAKQVPGPEEMKKLALDHLNKKLHRANKFGAEQSVIDEINRSINRVEKFGLDLQNPLAVELGLVEPQSNQKNRQLNSNRRKYRSRNNSGASYGNNGRNNRYRVRKRGYISNNNNNRGGGASGRRY